MTNVKKYQMNESEITTLSKNLGLGIGKILKIDPDRVEVALQAEDTVTIGATKFRAGKLDFTVDKKMATITATERQEIAGHVLSTTLPMRADEVKRLRNDKTVLDRDCGVVEGERPHRAPRLSHAQETTVRQHRSQPSGIHLAAMAPES